MRRPERIVATMDHSTPTEAAVTWQKLRVVDPQGAAQLEELARYCAEQRWPRPSSTAGARPTWAGRRPRTK